ncbi:Vesicle-fusing ATPase 1 [Diplonema papillatum]|nr:Vesicle-fusing ATPase 1 [Diplonema papillatum]
MLKVLIEGDPGSGLTTVASFIAKRAQFPFIHMLGHENFVGLQPHEISSRITDAFENAYLVENSCIIIDNLEHILEQGGSSINPALQHTIWQLLSRKPDGKGKLLVIVTTNSADSLRYLGFSSWDMRVDLPYLDKPASTVVLQELQVFETETDVKKVVRALPAKIGVKKLLWLIDEARIAAGIDEDIHRANLPVQQATVPLPFMSGKTQYFAPQTDNAREKKQPERFEPFDIEEGWNEDGWTSEARRKQKQEKAAAKKRREREELRKARGEDDDLYHGWSDDIEEGEQPNRQTHLTPKGFIDPELFVDLLEEAGLLSSETEGIPVATGHFVL